MKKILVILLLILSVACFAENEMDTIDLNKRYGDIESSPRIFLWVEADSNTYALNSMLAENIEAVMQEYFVGMNLTVVDKSVYEVDGIKKVPDKYKYLYDHNIKIIIKVNAETENNIDPGFSLGKNFLGFLSSLLPGSSIVRDIIINNINLENTTSQINIKFIDMQKSEVFYAYSFKNKNMYVNVFNIAKKSSKEQVFGTLKGTFEKYLKDKKSEMKVALLEKWKTVCELNVYKLNIDNISYKEIENLKKELNNSDGKIEFCESQNYSAGTAEIYIESKSNTEEFLSVLGKISVNGKTLIPQSNDENSFYIDLSD